MKILNDNGNEIVANFSFQYKGYDIYVGCDPSDTPKMLITLNDEDVNASPVYNPDDDHAVTIESAMEWIDEDIRCREEENREEKHITILQHNISYHLTNEDTDYTIEKDDAIWSNIWYKIIHNESEGKLGIRRQGIGGDFVGAWRITNSSSRGEI